jgi:hypothetical protein
VRLGIQAKQVSVRRCIATADVMLVQSTIGVCVCVCGRVGVGVGVVGVESACKLATDICFGLLVFWEGDMTHVSEVI